MLQYVYNKCSRWPPSGWMHDLADFIAPTEMGGCPIMLVAHVMASVKSASSIFSKS